MNAHLKLALQYLKPAIIVRHSRILAREFPSWAVVNLEALIRSGKYWMRSSPRKNSCLAKQVILLTLGPKTLQSEEKGWFTFVFVYAAGQLFWTGHKCRSSHLKIWCLVNLFKVCWLGFCGNIERWKWSREVFSGPLCCFSQKLLAISSKYDLGQRLTS